MSAVGQVFLVGAGPGDPDYLTLKAHRLLMGADVIVYDRLVSPEILDLVPPGTMRISAGKAPGNHTMTQGGINELLVTLAQAGRKVVRLKGGDPFIFGRGSEEAIYLARHGIAYEVVPGITSAQGGAAQAGIPLTHRGVASSVRYVTGHCQKDQALDLDWDGLADGDTTLVVYMGLANIAEICTRLMAHGASPHTPAAALNNACTPRQKQISAPLAGLAAAACNAGFEGPVLFVIGDVVALAPAMAGRGDAVLPSRYPAARSVAAAGLRQGALAPQLT